MFTGFIDVGIFAGMHEHIEGLYFYTATCLNWLHLLKSDRRKEIITNSLSYFVDQGLITIYGFVIMPNHIHLLLSVKDRHVRGFQLSFMKYTAQMILADMQDSNDPLLKHIQSTQADRKLQFWERRPKWKSLITSSIFYQKLAYVHNNPVRERWKLCNAPEKYAMSSAKSYSQGKSEFDFLTLYD